MRERVTASLQAAAIFDTAEIDGINKNGEDRCANGAEAAASLRQWHCV
jgi:hypothetical protein